MADISPMRRPFATLLLSTLLLTGCDQLGIETPAVANARKDADSKAIGGACRHAGRAIEDCYTLNKKADKAAFRAAYGKHAMRACIKGETPEAKDELRSEEHTSELQSR